MEKIQLFVHAYLIHIENGYIFAMYMQKAVLNKWFQYQMVICHQNTRFVLHVIALTL